MECTIERNLTTTWISVFGTVYHSHCYRHDEFGDEPISIYLVFVVFRSIFRSRSDVFLLTGCFGLFTVFVMTEYVTLYLNQC